MADRVVHRQVFQLAEARVVQDPDAVSGADPDLAVNALKALDIGQRRHISDANRLKAVGDAAVVDMGIFRAEIDQADVKGVGEDADHVLDVRILTADKVHDPAVLHREQIPELRQAVEQPVIAGTQIAHVGIPDALILDAVQIQVAVDGRNTGRRGHIHDAVFILGDGPDVGGVHSVRLSPGADPAVLDHGDAVVVGADPQAVKVVDIEADCVGNARGRIHTHKAVAVIADQAAVAADPDKALAGLGDGVGLGGRKTVGVVVENGRVALGFPDQVYRGLPVDNAGGIQVFRPGPNRAEEGQQHGQKQQECSGSPAGSVP